MYCCCMKKIWLKRIIGACLGFALILLILLFYANQRIISSSQGKIYADVHKIPANDFGLVLGTSKYLGRYLNPYFKRRIEAAAELYHEGKVKHLVVSGDNSSDGYNEPEDMKRMLMEKGVPSDAITCDYAGLRTFDSMIRMKEIFGCSKFTIISQQFHNERALYIAECNALDCIAFNAKEVYRGPKSLLREYFARLNAVLDNWFGTQPKYLGKKEYIVLRHQR